VPRRSRAATLVAIIAMLLAAPFERGRSCDVCPVDCPMHAAAGKARHLGCHQGARPTSASAAGDDGGCAMRASCGHHERALLATFAGDLPPTVTATPVVTTGRVRIVGRIPVRTEPRQPPHRPPEPPVV
jgi:hypothetical protein